MKRQYTYTRRTLSASGQKAPARVNVLIIAWIAGIGGHIAERDWLRDGAALTGAVIVVVWLAGVVVKDMFRRKSGKDDGMMAERAGRENAAPEWKPSEHHANAGRLTVIGSEASLNGSITDGGDVEVWGRFYGDIILVEGCVEVMRGGYVEGNIRATEVVINGTVRGRCEGGSVSIMEHGQLEGDCCVVELVIHHGGRFVGTSEVSRVAEELPTEIKDDTGLTEISEETEGVLSKGGVRTV
ncbi:polymer-forming cytoskeletal protein [Escherichia coli]|nr:polymer-forming cytoskeletal protein [Escherichia coli]EFL0486625.1 polymer-forming cytoskeletal protein [Escherichia coli]EFO4367923.1 polymer-forming cytoskeletal protein [Escherichia coli]HAJ7149572.1 polymer-forming cytoskeletal protein [Escherichia coli]HAJ7188561.1 polymer-forming cytoskeletal protein [Escherichia coli]